MSHYIETQSGTVERLRERAEAARDGGHTGIADDFEDAANTIEGLRKQIRALTALPKKRPQPGGDQPS